MQFVIDWFIENYEYLLFILISIVEFFLLLIFKKRPEVIDNGICFKLTKYVKQAESIYGSGHGKEKLLYVISKYREVNPNIDAAAIAYFVDEILSTPQKKGGK